jgi:hypothetical protein
MNTTPRTLGEAVDAGEPMTECFQLMAKLAEKRGYMPIGFRRMEVGEFIVTVNGTRQRRADEIGFEIEPFEASVSRHGMPLGWFAMFSGLLFAGVEQALIEAFTQALFPTSPQKERQ